MGPRLYLRIFAVIFGIPPLVCAGPVRAQDAPYTIHVQQNEVVADLFAVDHSTYVPDSLLKVADVVITDDTTPVKLTSFTHSGDGSLRPLALWIVTQCDMKGWDSSGSRFVQGRAATMAGGLTHLHAEDTIAFAGWCDDGRKQVSASGHNAAAVLDNVEQWIQPIKLGKGTSKRKGELTLQAMLRDISAAVTATRPRPLPVLIFLHQDDTGTEGAEYSRVLGILLEQSSIAFLVTDGKGTYQPSDFYLASGNVAHVLQALTADTGGSAMVAGSFQDHPNLLSDVLASMIDRLHSRYQYSFVPQKLDGRVHSLAARLSEAGRTTHRGTLLETRRLYLAPQEKSRGN